MMGKIDRKKIIFIWYICVYIYIFKEKRNYEKRDKYYDFDMILYLYYLWDKIRMEKKKETSLYH